ncbi:MAG: RES domain-containing protein [Bacteroidetes bacterium]|nr:RES domain-containing protein [Bacteroidota bacterium]
MNVSENNLCCVSCFSDPEIQCFIKQSANLNDCDYCQSKNVYVREVSEVGDFIRIGISRRYEDAANSVSYESAEGGYQLSTKDVYNILIHEEQIFGEALDDPYPLAKDLIQNDGTPYVRRDPYGPESGGYEKIKTWNEFCELVKRKQRYTVFLQSEDEYLDEEHPSNFLQKIAESINGRLIDYIRPGEKIYRARLITEGTVLDHKNLTSPPDEKTKNCRMSPAGVSFFYGGFDEATCIAEVRPGIRESVAVAEFEVLKDLCIVDLSIEFSGPLSIFNESYTFEYEEYFKPFFSHFVSDIAKPIRIADSEIDYIPTQIFSEFIRVYQFKDWNNISNSIQQPTNYKIGGIKFKSSLKKGGINIVLFKGPEISTEHKDSNSDAWLLYKGERLKKHVITEIKVIY